MAAVDVYVWSTEIKLTQFFITQVFSYLGE
jgi:hypothetical protein